MSWTDWTVRQSRRLPDVKCFSGDVLVVVAELSFDFMTPEIVARYERTYDCVGDDEGELHK